MVLGTLMKLCVTEFSEKKFFLPQNWEKGPKMGQKQGFFNLLENLVINFYWIWYKWKSILFSVFLHKSHIWEDFCFWDMGQMFSANQIAGFFNQPFCMVVQIQESQKLFQWFLGGPGQKWVQSFSSWDPKICWIGLWIERWLFAW